MTKEKAHELVDHMPESFTADDLIEQIIIMQKLEKAREQIDSGDYLTEEEFDKEIDTWD